MKPNVPNTQFERKTFASLSGLGIVGKYVTQTPESNFVPSATPIQQPLDEALVRGIAEEVFNSSTPSMIGDQFKLPDIPSKQKIYVLGAVNGEVKWLETESCNQ